MRRNLALAEEVTRRYRELDRCERLRNNVGKELLDKVAQEMG